MTPARQKLDGNDMVELIYMRTAELLSGAVFPFGHEDGLVSSFSFARPGSNPGTFVGRIGTEISYGRRELIRAALYVREHGPAYLRYLSVDDIWSILQEAVSENFWYISDGNFGFNFSDPKTSYGACISPQQKQNFAAALAQTKILVPEM